MQGTLADGVLTCFFLSSLGQVRGGIVSKGTLQATCTASLGKRFSPPVRHRGKKVYCLSMLQVSLLAHTMTSLQTRSRGESSPRPAQRVCSDLQDHGRQQRVWSRNMPSRERKSTLTFSRSGTSFPKVSEEQCASNSDHFSFG